MKKNFDLLIYIVTVSLEKRLEKTLLRTASKQTDSEVKLLIQQNCKLQSPKAPINDSLTKDQSG